MQYVTVTHQWLRSRRLGKSIMLRHVAVQLRSVRVNRLLRGVDNSDRPTDGLCSEARNNEPAHAVCRCMTLQHVTPSNTICNSSSRSRSIYAIVRTASLLHRGLAAMTASWQRGSSQCEATVGDRIIQRKKVMCGSTSRRRVFTGTELHWSAYRPSNSKPAREKRAWNLIEQEYRVSHNKMFQHKNCDICVMHKCCYTNFSLFV